MGGTSEGTDVLGQWLASRQPVGGERVAARPRHQGVARAATTTEPAAPTEPAATAAPAAPAEAPAPAPPAAPPEPTAPRGHPLAPRPVDAPPRPDVEFARRNGTQRLASVLLLAALAGTAVVGWMAWDRASTTATGVAAIGLLLTIGLWFLRAASMPPRVRITSGVLQIEVHGERHTWDLNNPYLRLTVHGRVGRPGWQVRLLRPQQPAYVVDASVVDPREFMAFLRSYRPEL